MYKKKILEKYSKVNFDDFIKWLFKLTANEDTYYNAYEKMIVNKDFGEQTDLINQTIHEKYLILDESLEGLIESYENEDKFNQIKYTQMYNDVMDIEEIELDEIDAGLLSIKLSKMERGSNKLKKELNRIVETYTENEFFYKLIEPYTDELNDMFDVDNL